MIGRARLLLAALPGPARRFTWCFCLGVSLWLAGCAPPLKDPWGLSVLRGEAPSPQPIPATFQADLGVQPRAPGSFPFSTRLYAEPSRRYRLDVQGFPSLIAASWLWDEGQWVLVRHDKREVRKGSGAGLEQDGVPLRLPDVHAVLGFLWGAPLPGFPGRDSAAGARRDGSVRWTHAGEPWEARFDPVTGVCREARSPSLALRYASHRAHGKLAVPEEVEVFVGGESVLVLSVREWIVSPQWKKDPFSLSIPDSYEHR
jgi:hypothetical protein